MANNDTYISLFTLQMKKQLVAATPERTSVTAIAMNHGFNHLGRFSVDYRKHFGESPRATLNRNKTVFRGVSLPQLNGSH